MELAGKRANKTFEPSKGGMGTKLNTAKTKFKKAMKKAISKKAAGKPKALENLISTPKTAATKKLLKGPAIPTTAGPYF